MTAESSSCPDDDDDENVGHSGERARRYVFGLDARTKDNCKRDKNKIRVFGFPG